MEKQASHKVSYVRLSTVVATLLLVSFLIGGWRVIAREQQPVPTEKKAPVSNATPQDVYTAYKDVVYKLSARDGSVIWKFALKQAYQPNRIIGSTLRLDIVNDVVYATMEYSIYALHASSG